MFSYVLDPSKELVLFSTSNFYIPILFPWFFWLHLDSVLIIFLQVHDDLLIQGVIFRLPALTLPETW